MTDWLSGRPELASQFDTEKNHPLRPEDVPAGSNKKFWWKCASGHSWQSQANSRTRRGHGCPYCSGRFAISGVNDLATLFPELAEEWHPDNPAPANEVKPYVNRTAWWIGKCGHEFETSIAGRTKKQQGCPYCSGRRVAQGFNDLATSHPDLAKEWGPKNSRPPEEFTKGSNVKVWWRCLAGHEWEQTVNNRAGRGSGCPYCAGNQVAAGETDLLTTHPALAQEWNRTRNTLSPHQVSAGSEKRVWWDCPKGHSWEALVAHRVRGYGCTICAGKIILPGFNDLESQLPQLMEIWSHADNVEDPKAVSATSYKSFRWKCPEGHIFSSSVNALTRGRGCAVCSGKQVIEGVNDLASSHHEVAQTWHPTKNRPLTPFSVTKGSSRKVWWVCPLGHEYESQISNRTKGAGCGVCDNKIILPGFNDLATLRPELLARWNYAQNSMEPDEIGLGSQKKVWWKCDEGHEWLSTPANQASGHDCPECGRFGYRGAMPGLLYLLDSEKLGAGKVGITNLNTRNSRIEILGQFGFKVLRTWEHQDGFVIRSLETETLRYLRKELKFAPYLSKQDMGQIGGWKETFSRHVIEDFDLADWIDARYQSLASGVR